MDLELRRISLWPLFRNTFLVTALLFLIFLIFMGNMVVQMMNQSMADMGMGSSTLSGPLSFFTLLTLALSNALFFSLFVTVAGALYNFISHWTGGITFEFSDLYEEYDGYYGDEEPLPDETILPDHTENDTDEETDKE